CVHSGSQPEPAEPAPVPAATAAGEPAVVRDRPAALAFDDRGRLVTLEADALRVWGNPPRCDRSARGPLPRVPGMSMPLLASSRDGRTMAIGLAPSREGRGTAPGSGPPRDGRGQAPGPGSPRDGRRDGPERVGQVLLWRSGDPGELRLVKPPPGVAA